MNYLKTTLVFGLALAVGAVSALPAALLSWALSHGSGGAWFLANEEGSFWQGSGQLAYRAGNGPAVPGSRVAWRFEPAKLLEARLSWQIRSDSRQGTLWLTPGGLHAQSLALRVPLDALSSTAGPWKQAGLRGDATLQITDLSYRDSQWRGGATLQLSGVAAQISSVKPLGDYVLSVVAKGDGFDLGLSSMANPLKLSGSGHWRSGGGVRLDGVAEAAGKEAPELRPVMALLGRTQPSGRVNWQLGG